MGRNQAFAFRACVAVAGFLDHVGDPFGASGRLRLARVGTLCLSLSETQSGLQIVFTHGDHRTLTKDSSFYFIGITRQGVAQAAGHLDL
jgi:hypothetical protein